MIIIRIIGGLGNQMFQYAYAKALKKNGHDVKLDISSFDTYKLHGGYQLNKYNIEINSSTNEENNFYNKKTILSKILNKIGIKNSKQIKEKNLLFDAELLNVNDEKYIEGYFQSEKYFQSIRTELIEDFVINSNISDYTKYMEQQIMSESISVSIHIRRGDYISDVKSNNIHGTCTLEYYQDAVDIMNTKFKNVKYFIFSDDIVWVKENLDIENSIYLESKEKRIPHEDIYLMSLCSHNIIANSSFSWWGAWLNQNENKIVIAPKRWFWDKVMYEQSKGIVCDSWMKI